MAAQDQALRTNSVNILLTIKMQNVKRKSKDREPSISTCTETGQVMETR